MNTNPILNTREFVLLTVSRRVEFFEVVSRSRRPRDRYRYAIMFMSHSHYYAIAMLVLVLTDAPLHSQGTDARTEKLTQKVTQKIFSDLLFAEDKEIVLMSHNGRWEGMDNGLELRLNRDGTALVIDYGYGVSKTRGKYKVNNDGTIVISPAGETPWLAMMCSIEKGLLVIRPPGKEELFAAARKAGIAEGELTDEAYHESYEQWPLRQIDPKENGVTMRCNEAAEPVQLTNS